MLILHILMITAPDQNVVKHIVEHTAVEIFVHSANCLMQLGQIQNTLLFVVFTSESLD